MKVSFVAYCKPQSQGSMKSFLLPNKDAIAEAARVIAARAWDQARLIEIITDCVKKARAILTSDNPELKKYRREVEQAAKKALQYAGADGVMAGKHVPVEIKLEFIFERPPSVSKRRVYPVVKPDIDKILRSTLDALTGCVYEDDAQVVSVTTGKRYGEREAVMVSAWTLDDGPSEPLIGNLFPEPKEDDF